MQNKAELEEDEKRYYLDNLLFFLNSFGMLSGMKLLLFLFLQPKPCFYQRIILHFSPEVS